MFRWFRKQLLKGIVKDLLKELPDAYAHLKDKALVALEKYPHEILEKVKIYAVQAVHDFIKERLGF